MLTNNSITSQVFGESSIRMEGALKNPNQFREAVIFESLRTLPVSRLKEFVNSKEAKTMLNEGIISQDTLERLSAESDNGTLKTTVCHMAKENGDPLWDEFIKLRIEERRLMNELLDKYRDKASVIADNAEKEFVESCIPKYFLNM